MANHSGPEQEVAERMGGEETVLAPLERETYKRVMGQVRGAEMDGRSQQ